MKKIFKKTVSAVSAAVVSVSFCFSAANGAFDLSPGKSLDERQSFDTSSMSMALPRFTHIPGTDEKSLEPMPPQVYTSEMSVYSEKTDFPAAYDLRKTSGMTTVRDQGQYGTCWAHSSAASAESDVLISDPSIDISEMHTAYFPFYGEDQIDPGTNDIVEILNHGGVVNSVVNLWAQWIGPVREEKMPYGDLTIFQDQRKIEELSRDSDYHLENAYLFDYDYDRTNFEDVNTIIKEFVYSGHGVDVSFFADTTLNYSYTYSTSNTNRKPRFANHAVTICGWDDNKPASEFRNSPEGNGGWLCKNSWNGNFGEDGYFWISYYDSSLCSFGVYDLGDKNNYDRIYQHDTFVSTNSMSAHGDAADKPSYMANIFNSSNGDDIQAVSTYFNAPGTEYEVMIYSNLSDPSDPVSGVGVKATEGVSGLTGYQTIELDKDVYVDPGNFSVVVKMYCPETSYVLPVETCLYAEQPDSGAYINISKFTSRDRIEKFTGENESFYSIDGENWNDICGEIYTYTDEEEAMLLDELEFELFDGIEPDTDLWQEAQELLDNYTEIFAECDVKIISGNVSLKAFGSDSAPVRFSHISGEVPTNEKISLSAPEGEEILVSVNGGEYLPYTEPFEVTEEMTVSVTTDRERFAERTFEPAYAEFFEISGDSVRDFKHDLKRAKRISKSEYVLEVNDCNGIFYLYPMTNADIIMDGQKIEQNTMTPVAVSYGDTVVNFDLSRENALDNHVTLTIKMQPVRFDIETETIVYTGASEAYDSEGTKILNGEYIGDRAGETITAVARGSSYQITVPERNELPDLTLDHYSETLGFIPNRTAELLVYTTDEDEDADYISAENRLIDGAWISSGMIMNKAFMVIPGETIKLKISSGDGKFASRAVIYNIPDAPDAPSVLPKCTYDEGQLVLEDFVYEMTSSAENYFDSIDEMAEYWGYKDVERFSSVIFARYGVDDYSAIKKYSDNIWDVRAAASPEDEIALRYAATDDNFASKCIYINAEDLIAPANLNGDVDGDGIITGSDATLILRHYTQISSNAQGIFTTQRELDAADYDSDGIITGSDATMVLMLYTQLSSGR